MGSLRVVRTSQDAIDMMAWLGERHPVIALDTETTTTDLQAPWFAVRLVQFGDTDNAWVVPMGDWAGLVKEAIRKYQGKWSIHNAQFDIPALACHDIHVPWAQVDDTMIAIRLAESNMPSGLKEASTRHVASGSATGQKELLEGMAKNKWTWATVPLDYPPYLHYAAMDVILGSRLWEHPVTQVGMHSPVYDLEMQTLVICLGMTTVGLRVDRGYCQENADVLRQMTRAISADMIERYEGLSVGSTKQLGNMLLSKGANITMVTKGGAPATDKTQLSLLLYDPSSSDHVRYICDQTLRYRKADKMAGSYLENFLVMADAEGLLHADIQTLAAKTGRMSIRNPALQTLPKPNDDPASRLVRKAVIPREDSHVLLSADYEQIEMRLAAAFSKDSKLLQAFATADADPEADFFAEMGKIIHRDPNFNKADQRRKTIKNAMYAMLYGAGPDKIAVTAGVSFETARMTRAEILGAFPGTGRAMQRYEREVRENGSVKTILGRKLQVDSRLAYKGLNACIQGSAADLFKRAIVYLAHAGFDRTMVVPVHDEMVFSLPREDVAEARHEIRKAMEISELSIPIPADPSEGMSRWSDD